ncbi:MAG: DNA-binding protein Alba [Candidatus Hydrothermarchaeales archaeon]
MAEKAGKAGKAEKRADDNVVYIGKKPVMNYVLAVTTQLGNGDEVIIKSRGQAISRAVDTAEIVRNRFMTEVKVKKIDIMTEQLTREDGSTMNVSAMEIVLTK